MGRYYIEAAGQPAEIAAVAQEHYSPLGPSDDVPTAPLSVAVALADKIDMLTGFWAIDEKPTGSKDPFALRRAALGVIRLVLENGLRIDFRGQFLKGIWYQRGFAERAEALTKVPDLLNRLGSGAEDLSKYLESTPNLIAAAEVLQSVIDQQKISALAEANALIELNPIKKTDDLLAFLHDRLKVYLRDQGIRHDIIDACIAMPGNDDLALLVMRAQALDAVLKTEDGENLLQGFKRAYNILTQAEDKDGVEYSFGADPKFAEDATETALFGALDAAQARISPALEAQDFPAAMTAMAELRAPIDAFFEAVQVNSDNQIVRRNRLNLLGQIREICLNVADLTRIEG